MKKLILIIAFALIGVTAFSQKVWKFQSTRYSTTTASSTYITSWDYAVTNFYIGDATIICTGGTDDGGQHVKLIIDSFKKDGNSIIYNTHSESGSSATFGVFIKEDNSIQVGIKFRNDNDYLWYYVPPGYLNRVQ